MSRNQEKPDFKNSQICPIWYQSGEIEGRIRHPWGVELYERASTVTQTVSAREDTEQREHDVSISDTREETMPQHWPQSQLIGD